MPQDSFLSRGARSLAGLIRRDSTPDNALAGGLDTAANWADWTPQDGRDTLAPLGGGMLASLAARPPAIALRQKPVPNGVTEWPVQAAIQVGDRVFGGVTHFDALQRAVPNALERDLWGSDLMRAFEREHGTRHSLDGFVTNQGRYVDRAEAARLASERLEAPRWFELDAVANERALARAEGRAPAQEAIPYLPSWLQFMSPDRPIRREGTWGNTLTSSGAPSHSLASAISDIQFPDTDQILSQYGR